MKFGKGWLGYGEIEEYNAGRDSWVSLGGQHRRTGPSHGGGGGRDIRTVLQWCCLKGLGSEIVHYLFIFIELCLYYYIELISSAFKYKASEFSRLFWRAGAIPLFLLVDTFLGFARNSFEMRERWWPTGRKGVKFKRKQWIHFPCSKEFCKFKSFWC